MDLNYFLHRHQVSLIHAAHAETCEARNIHRRFASAYATRIDAIAELNGAGTAALVEL